jgi:CheY-like chemotaxis protein
MKKVRILLVEDRKSARTTIKGMLRGLKYTIDEAKSGEEALERLRRVNFDAIILDIGLPGIDGIEMLRKAQQFLASLPPVVVLTQYQNVENAFKAGKIDAFRFVAKLNLKPASFKEVVIAAVNYKQELTKIRVKRCFKHNQDGCNISLKIPPRLVFVGIPFSMKRVYSKGIRDVVESFNSMTCWRADELRRTGDFTCKICGMIQEAQIAIFDISTQSANVMMELGFALGLGKDIIILKNRKARLPANLGVFEPIEYASIAELSRRLRQFLRTYFDDR